MYRRDGGAKTYRGRNYKRLNMFSNKKNNASVTLNGFGGNTVNRVIGKKFPHAGEALMRKRLISRKFGFL